MPTKILVSGVNSMKSDKQFVNVLEDDIKQRGEMEKLMSDSDQSDISTRVKYILRTYSSTT